MTFTRCMWPPVTLPQWLSGKESACNAGDTGDSGLIPVCGRSPGGRNGNPLQYSCLENPMGYSLWGHKESDMTSDNIWIFFDTTCSPIWGIPGGLSGIKSICQCRRHNESWAQSLVRKIPWRRACNPLQYSCLENPMDRGTWPTVYMVSKSQTQLKWLSSSSSTAICKQALMWKWLCHLRLMCFRGKNVPWYRDSGNYYLRQLPWIS